MGFKDLLVQADTTRACGARLDLATRLATEYRAHLVGLYVAPRWEIPGYVRMELPAEALAGQERAAREAAAAAEAEFDRHVRQAGLTAEWRGIEGDPAGVASLHARYADLAILGQSDPDDPEAAGHGAVVEEVLLTSGRPVLVVPYAGRFGGLGDDVLVAWNASREAARAVNDALPILTRAQRVTVLAINPRGGPDGHGEVPGADIALHLARHGIRVEASRIEAEDIDVGDALLSRAADLGIDLIVMGGYGRSRLRELVLGGVTRHLLHHMTVPVFMSH